MKVKMRIRQPGTGSARYNQTSFLWKHDKKVYTDVGVGTLNRYGEAKITSERSSYAYKSKEDDPVFASLNKTLDKILFKFPRNSNTTYDKFMAMITFKHGDGNSMLMISKDSGYSLNGRRMTKQVLLGTLSRIMYRSCFCDSAVILHKYVMSLLEVPPNVRYAIENKCPYYFYAEDGNPYRKNKIEVRLTIKRISKTECAMELSENIWCPIPIKSLDQFLNHYRNGKSQSKKWTGISPVNLWKELFGEEPSKGQKAMMIAWMLQNRTDKMVEDTAKGLMYEIARENENVKTFKFTTKTAEKKISKMGMLVSGTICDWVLLENTAAKTSPQRVSIYCFHEDEDRKDEATMNTSKNTFMNGRLKGPVCVNNSVGNVSLGDQFVSRIFTLMNDELAMKKVGTLRGYVPDNARVNSHRIDMKLFSKWLQGPKKKKQETPKPSHAGYAR